MRWILFLATIVLLAATALACGDDESSEPGGATPAAGELRAQGRAVTMIVSPAEDSTLSGTVQISVSEVPEGTVSVWFSLVPEGGDVRQGAPSLGRGSESAEGWKLSFDTTGQADGVYTLVALAFDVEQLQQGIPPVDIAQVEVTIANGAAR